MYCTAGGAAGARGAAGEAEAAGGRPGEPAPARRGGPGEDTTRQCGHHPVQVESTI